MCRNDETRMGWRMGRDDREKRWENKVVKHFMPTLCREEGDFSKSIGRAISGQDNGNLGEFLK